ncbi:MAG: isochorismatase family protein [Curvibacter sp.]
MLLELEDSQLLLVDYQTRLMPVIHEGPAVLANALRLAQMARLFQVPTFLTEENPGGLGATVPELQALVAQARGKVFPKMSFSAVADGLGELLRPPARAPQGNARSLPKHLQKPAQPASERGSIVLAGCETHVCLLQTALDLLDDEFEVWVVTDACGSRSERNRDAAFDRLAGAGAELVTTEMVAFEWLRSAEHPAFAEVLALVKA